MLTAIAKNFVSPENHEKFLKTAQPLIDATRREEGNIFYNLCALSEAEPGFVFMECWKDQASLDEHMGSAHFKAIVPQLHELCSKPGVFEIFENVY